LFIGIETTDEPVSFDPAEKGEFSRTDDLFSGKFEFYQATCSWHQISNDYGF